jgi:hypothetical protein
MKLSKIYGNAVFRDLGRLRANWEPGAARQVGDYGIVEDGVFQYQGHVKAAVNCTLVVEETVANEDLVNFNSDKMQIVPIDLGTSVGPGGIPLVKAGLVLKFDGSEAVCFQIKVEKRSRLVNLDPLAYEITRKFESRQWPEERVVVLETTTASSGFVFVAESGKRSFQFEAMLAELADLDLFNPKLKLSYSNETKKSLHWKIASPATPLLRIGKMEKVSLFGSHIFRGTDSLEQRSYYSRQDLRSLEMAQRQTLSSTPQQKWLFVEYEGE